jgi:ATP-dependent protease ClpP protease subunit
VIFSARNRLRQRVINYIRRHWRGEFSLAKSFWVNNVLLNISIDFIGYVLLAVFSHSFIITTRIEFVGYFVEIFVILPWQMIGLWRSCIAHIKQYDRRIWARVAQVIIVLNVVMIVPTLVWTFPSIRQSFHYAFLMDAGDYYTMNIEHEGTILSLKCAIIPGLSNVVEKTLKDNPQIEGLILNTPGGYSEEGFRLAEVVSRYKLNTYVIYDCCSAGTLAFVAGKQRYVTKLAFLGFHQSGFNSSEMVLWGNVPEWLLIEKYKETKENIKSLFSSQGVKEEFIEHMNSVPHKDMWYPSQEELFEAGVIHGLVDMDLNLIEMLPEDANSLRDKFRLSDLEDSCN